MELRSVTASLSRVSISTSSATSPRCFPHICRASSRRSMPHSVRFSSRLAVTRAFHSSPCRSAEPSGASSPPPFPSSPYGPASTKASSRVGDGSGHGNNDYAQQRAQASAALGWTTPVDAAAAAEKTRRRSVSGGGGAETTSGPRAGRPGQAATPFFPHKDLRSSPGTSASDLDGLDGLLTGSVRDPYDSAYDRLGQAPQGRFPPRPASSVGGRPAAPKFDFPSPLKPDPFADMQSAEPARGGGLTRMEQDMQRQLQRDIAMAPRRPGYGMSSGYGTGYSSATATPPMQLGPRVGRTIRVGQAFEVGKAISTLEMALSRNKIRTASMQGMRHERAGAKAKRLRRQRWRLTFKKGFAGTVKRVMEIRGMGWH